ncbi:MAG: methyltransferase domain-containing protein [Sphingobacteriales bacterium]|nr:MAG: methyltransferase domain-containing protein [Sphingobacteriales bacterium]
MAKMRKPFQGVLNILRFNWHFFLLAIVAAVSLQIIKSFLTAPVTILLNLITLAIVGATFLSLIVSWYIYDISSLYKLTWLQQFPIKAGETILNIHAGFDETSELLEKKFPETNVLVFDFFDRRKHTEASIRRARKAYPPYPHTRQIETNYLPLSDNSVHTIFGILSLHEIRNEEERTIFFKEMKRILVAGGKIVITEHLRDSSNLGAYNIGALHFHTRSTWLRSFKQSGFSIADEFKITAFITTFILQKNGTAS